MRWFVRGLASWLGTEERASLSECMVALSEGEPSKESMVGSFCALLELIRLGVAAVEPGPDGGASDPLVSLCAGVSGDVAQLLDAVRFDDEVAPAEADDAPAEDSPGESSEESTASE
jgi:hypothetical protein